MFTEEELARFVAYESRGIEMRGIWHMPRALNPHFGFDTTLYDENTLMGVQRLLDKIQKIGFNTIFIETTRSAYTIYPSTVGTIDPAFANNDYGREYGNDYLKCFLGEAHKRGLSVHAWTTTMRAGSNQGSIENSLPKAINLEWLSRGYHEEYGLSGKYGELMWMDPSNEEVMAYIINQYQELITNYDFDGIELDAIRYPVCNIMSETDPEKISDFGYTQRAISSFKEKYQYYGDIKKDIIMDFDLKKKWQEFRISLINEVVKKIYSLVKSIKPKLPFSAAVFNNPSSSITTVCQDWVYWCDQDWFDFITPMAYSTDDSIVQRSFEVTEKLVDHRAFNLQGIASIIFGGTYLQHLSQMELINQSGGLGSILFSTRQLLKDEKTMAMLEIIYHNDQAISPLADLHEINNVLTSKLSGSSFEVILDDVNLINNLESLKEKSGVSDNYLVQVINTLINVIKIKTHRDHNE